MKKHTPIWRKFLTIAAAAFILGLLPYLWHMAFMDSPDVGFAEYLSRSAAESMKLLSEYVPLIAAAYVACIALLIFLEGQNPDRTILWLMTLIFLPVAGIILYMLLGPDMKRIKMRRLFKPTKSYPSTKKFDWGRTPAVRRVSILAYHNSSSGICERCGVEILIDGAATFSSIKRELRRAKRYINIEYFIFRDDALGREIAEILSERARDGLAVRMAVDGVGSWKLGRGLKSTLTDSGVLVKTFMPVSFPALHSAINYRNHRKIIVIDGEVAFTGGLNIGLDYVGKGPLGKWRDTHVLFRGDAVRALNAIFLSDWAICTGENFSPYEPAFAPPPGASATLPFTPTQIVAGGSGSAWRSIHQIFFTMITSAEKRIWITTPYLVPNEAILDALRVSALSGVDVRILLPKKSDHFLSHWAGFSNIEDLLRAGVRIWLYTDGFVHAKTLVMDDAIASVGTANLDNRSLEINFEVQAFIYDSKICSEVAGHFMADIETSEECLLGSWEKRGLGPKVLESLGKLWSSQI
ncbi:MAG: cardiolipin synthase [Synergistaceae bacterium]|jgi:cardiolipin synthase|nr:cardiolipin synthase [Synergistaceae bacterium]